MSKVDDVSQGAQDQRVNIIVEVNFVMVVLHGEDAVHRNSHVCAEPLHLCFKKNTSSLFRLQPQAQNSQSFCGHCTALISWTHTDLMWIRFWPDMTDPSFILKRQGSTFSTFFCWFFKRSIKICASSGWKQDLWQQAFYLAFMCGRLKQTICGQTSFEKVCFKHVFNDCEGTVTAHAPSHLILLQTESFLDFKSGKNISWYQISAWKWQFPEFEHESSKIYDS